MSADVVNITAQSVTVGDAKPPGPTPTTGERLLYFVNSLVLAVSLLLFAIWFSAHVESYLTQLAVVGTVTAFAIWQAIVSFVEAVIGKKDEVTKRLLANPRLLPYFLFAMVVALVLFTTTRSYYVKLGKTDASQVLIEIKESGKSLPEPLRLDADHTSAGRFFFALKSRNVELVSIEPRGYKPVQMTLSLGKPSQTVTFPFDAKKYHLLRITPTPDVQDTWPEPTDRAKPTLMVKVGDTSLGPVPFYRYSVVYVGAEEEDMRKIAQRRQGEFDREYTDRLVVSQIATGTAAEERAALIRNDVRYLGNIELQPQQKVTMTMTAGVKSYSSQLSVGSTNEVATVYLGDKQ